MPQWNSKTGKFEAYAAVEVLEVKTSKTRLDLNYAANGTNLAKFAATETAGEIDTGFVYVRARAISSRVNKNNDGWPSEELARAYRTFVGRPVFVDHNNQNPSRTRGVIVDAKLHVGDEDGAKESAFDPYYASAPAEHMPPTWIEILIEVDGQTYPKLAAAIDSGEIDAVSMGANIDRSICSVCANEATVPSQYCNHISNGKGATFEIVSANGEKLQKKAYEDCYGVNFFEISFVFDPADPTADAWKHDGAEPKLAGSMQKGAPYPSDSYKNAPDHTPKNQKKKWPAEVNAIYNACMREGNGRGDSKEEKESSCAAIAWAQYEKGDKKKKKSSSDEDEVIIPDYRYAHLIAVADSDDKSGDRQLNYEPQSEKVTAPQKVDTLRDDVTCPNCEADQLTTDPDGILRCPTCSYQQPPEGLDNPDLGKAKEFDDEQRDSESRDEEGNKETPVKATEDDIGDKTYVKPVQSLGSEKATNYTQTTNGINEMVWKRKVKTNNRAEARMFIASARKIAASIQTTLGGRLGIHNGTHGAMRAARLTCTVAYPEQIMATVPPPILGVIKDNVSVIPGNPMKDMFLGQHAVKELGLTDKSEVPVTVTADDVDAVMQIIHAQASGSDVIAATKNGPVTKQTVLPSGRRSDEPTNEKIVSDQLKPVTSDRRVIKREEHPDGRRTEQIVEETGDLGFDNDDNKTEDEVRVQPKKNQEGDEDKKDDPSKDSESSEKKLFAAFQIAEAAVDSGLIPKEHKMAFVSELEKASVERIEGYRAALGMVKSAGLVKRGLPAATSKVPRMGGQGTSRTASTNGYINLEDVPVEAVFYK